MIETFFRENRNWLLAALCVATFVLAKNAPVDYTPGDSLYTLLTSQALVEHATIRLDAYAPPKDDSRIMEKRDHRYDGFPLGTALFSVPFVWVATLRGEAMTEMASNTALQKTLGALALSMALLLAYLIARCFVDYGFSFLFAVAFILGSSVASTLGSALWSHDLALVLSLLVVLILVRYDRGRTESLHPLVLGALLAAAYLTRPTLSVLFVAVAVYMLVRSPHQFVITAATVAILLGLFALFSWREFGQPLPDYYLPGRLAGAGTFWLAVYGNLASPGRGVWVYSPFLVLTLVGTILLIKPLFRQPLFWFCTVWLILHLVTISRLGHWWGGWAYGSRFMTDVLPAWLVLTLLVWTAAMEALSAGWLRGGTIAFTTLATVAIFFNTVQGLYNPTTRQWNEWIDPTDPFGARAYMLDWRFPQFLSSPAMLETRRELYRMASLLTPIDLGDAITHDDARVAYLSWYDPESQGNDAWRWSNGFRARLIFLLAPFAGVQAGDLELRITAGFYSAQQVPVLVNGHRVGMMVNTDPWTPSTYAFPIEASLLHSPPQLNTIEFLIPAASSPAREDPNGDQRVLGVALRSVELRSTAGSDLR